jgi:hypothetical protein
MPAGFDRATLGIAQKGTRMIRQAHTYLVGAVSGTALVGAAIVAFVLLVSLQALKDWPLAGISVGGSDSSAVAPSSSGANSATPPEAGAAGATVAGAGAGGSTAPRANGRAAAQGNEAALAEAPTPAAGSPTAEAPSPGPVGHAGGGDSGSSPAGTASSSPQPAGGGGGGAPSTPAAGGGSSSSGSSSGQSTSGAVTGTVNKTVAGVDEATGGVIGDTGVTKVTEEVVNGVAGPESTVGHTVDEVVKTVNCLLGCKP